MPNTVGISVASRDSRRDREGLAKPSIYEKPSGSRLASFRLQWRFEHRLGTVFVVAGGHKQLVPSHSFPLNTFAVGLKRRVKNAEPGALVAQRLKRLTMAMASPPPATSFRRGQLSAGSRNVSEALI
jgi:hypothetical protein